MRRIHPLLFVLLCSGCAGAYEIKCGHVYAILKQHVRSSHAWPDLQGADACMSDAFVRKSLMYVNSTTLQTANGAFHLSNDSLALAELLTFSLIGRHVVHQEPKQVFFFSWNRYDGTLSLELLACEFSRPLYNFVLLFTLLTILSVVVLQDTVKVKSDPCQPPPDETHEATGAVAFRTAATGGRHEK
jgi:hypothetical protein